MSESSQPSWSGKWSTAWRAFAVEAANDLGKPWVLCGTGGKTRLVVEPVTWWLSSVGFNPGRMGAGDLFAAHQPLTVPWMPIITFSQQEYRGDDKPWAGLEPWAEDAGYVFRWWLTGPARAHFNERSEREWVELREKTFDLARDRRPLKWPMLAGFRVIYNCGPAEPVIDAVLDAIGDGLYYDDQQAWWEEFRRVVTDKPRADVLRWLDGQRRAGLAQAGVPQSAIADVLHGVV